MGGGENTNQLKAEKSSFFGRIVTFEFTEQFARGILYKTTFMLDVSANYVDTIPVFNKDSYPVVMVHCGNVVSIYVLVTYLEQITPK